MATDSADRNLLFGVLAVQLDFVSRDQLIAATSRWVLNKSQPLSQVFVEQGMLSAEESQLLDGVVLKHLSRNNDDPRQSLQSIEAFEAVRATLGNLADEDVRSTVEYATLPLAPPDSPTPGESTDPYSTEAALPEQQPDTANRFKILRLHQKGGLGRVSIALDEQLNREIALKEIQAAHADNTENRTRFIREAEITGALEHPGVVPVYSLGKFADGRPYYAMRFIRGKNLQVALEDYHKPHEDQAAQQLEFRQLLGRFVDVCLAMEYSHSRGVIHRDLKPGNIMLGDYGETLVVDWGLAKTLDDPVDSLDTMEAPVTTTELASTTKTQVGRVVGTPAYMSPEQAAGQLKSLGPHSDIYSLGATLYHVITGKVAFKGTEEEVLSNVQLGRFAKPREANPAVPRALEAICLKAMARLPSERYASGRELAADIERFLADERVLAYKEPLPARTWRWIRNHKPLVFSSAAALAVVVTALTISVVMLSAANVRVTASRDDARRSFEEANLQREIAERNFSLARDAVRDYYISVSEDTLLKQPGMQPLRESLLRQALVYYQNFLDQREDDPSLRQEVAQAHYFTGQITQSIDSPANALPNYEKAAAIQQQLLEAAPESQELRIAYGKTLNAQGDASLRIGQLDEANTLFERAIEVRDQLAKADPEDLEAARTLASSLMNHGFIAYLQGDLTTAAERMQHAQAIRTAHAGADGPLDPKLQRDLGMGYYNLALIFTASEDVVRAENNFLAAIDSFQQLLDTDPADMNNRRKLAACHRMVGELQSKLGNSSMAVDYFERARAALSDLRMRSPDVLEFTSDLAGVYLHLGLEQKLQEQNEAALSSILSATELLQTLLDQAGDIPRFQLDLARCYREAGKLHLAAERRDAAIDSLKQSIAVLSELVKADPSNERYTSDMQLTNDELARAMAPPVEAPPEDEVETGDDVESE